jgi:hypothetical protein
VINALKDADGIARVADFFRQGGDGLDVEVVDGGVEDVLSFVEDVSLAVAEALDLLRRQRGIFRRNTIESPAAGDAVNLRAGGDLEFEENEIAELRAPAGGRERRRE